MATLRQKITSNRPRAEKSAIRFRFLKEAMARISSRICHPPPTGAKYRVRWASLSPREISIREKCLSAGMNGYISKPLRPNALEETIEEWTAGKPAIVDQAPVSPEGLSPSETAVAFDRVGFVERMMLDEDMACKMVRRFMEDMPRQIASLAQAVTDLDTKAVRLVAHSIKGAAANVSGLEMREIAWKLEQAGGASDLTAATAALPELSASFERVRSTMERFCRQDPSI